MAEALLPAGAREFDLVVAGEINPDIIVLAADPQPIFGQVEKLVDVISLEIGSSSAIVACGAARLGLRVAFVGVVGADAFGTFMLEALAARDIDVTHCRVDRERATGATVILGNGRDRAMLSVLGTTGTLQASDVPADLLASARHLHVGSYYLQAAAAFGLPALFGEAHRYGLTTSIDPGWDPAEGWDGGIASVLPLTDVFLPNAAEARAIADRRDDEDAARALAGEAAGARRVVVVKRGDQGAIAAGSSGLMEHVPAFPVDPVDTTGAGDSFDAGFIFGWLAGWSVEACLNAGAVCGALSTRAAGGVSAQPSHQEFVEALRSFPSHLAQP